MHHQQISGQADIADELSRIEAEYMQRAQNTSFAGRYSLFNEATLLQTHGVERDMLAMLKRHHFSVLKDKRILDVGCGSGMHLQRFLAYGAQASNLAGIDLLPERIERARNLYPAIDWRQGSAHQLPYPDASFDLVTLFVVFSSILNHTLRQQIADEIWRVLKPDGLILCYDFAYSNPHNAAVQGITQHHIRVLFARPNAHFTFKRTTLAPPIARRLAPRSRWLADTLEHLKFLDTHVLSLVHLDACI